MTIRTLLTLTAATALLAPATAISDAGAARVGSLEATGQGTLVARGNLTAFGKVDGALFVRDRQGRAVVKVNGVRQRPRLVRAGFNVIRVYRLKNVSGGFYAQGRDIRVELRSPEATLSVTMFGRGTVMQLSGQGTYKLNAGVEKQWAEAVVPFRILPPPLRRATAVRRLAERSGIAI